MSFLVVVQIYLTLKSLGDKKEGKDLYLKKKVPKLCFYLWKNILFKLLKIIHFKGWGLGRVLEVSKWNEWT